MAELLPIMPPEAPTVTTTETTTRQTPQGPERTTTTTEEPVLLPAPPPWLSTQLRNLLLSVVTVTVVYLAYIGEEQARQSLYSAFTLLAGMLFGERAALRSPQSTPEK
jgi:hypothetical protein